MPKKEGLSASEKKWVIYYNRKGEEVFAITSTPIRDKHFLYKKNGSGWEKIDKAASPVDFEEDYNIREAINAK